MALDTGGILLPTDITAEQYNDVAVFTQNRYVNQFPLISRVPRIRVGTNTFKTRHKKYRPQKFVIGTAMTVENYSTLALTDQVEAIGVRFGDSSTLMAGDILEIGSERVEVMATPTTEKAALPDVTKYASQAIPAAGTVTVRRGAEGTTIATHATSVVPTLIGNSRNGGEVFQSGIRAVPLETTQYVQNFQFPVQVSGSAQASDVVGVADLFAEVKDEQLENMMRDMEKSSFYGIGEAPGTSGQMHGAKQKGLRLQVPIVSASTPGGYLPTNFITDALTPIWNNGGNPDTMFVSVDFMAGIDAWGMKAIRMEVGQNKYGLDIDVFTSSLAPAVSIIPCITLKPGTAFVCQSNLVAWRNKRNEFWNPRGIRGDAFEGDWIAEGAIEARDAEKHVWLEGVTAFSTP